MKHMLFAVYDAKAEAYLPPFTMHQQAMAIRAFTDAINDPTHQFNKHPGDYTLFNIGAYDDNDAKIVAQKTPHSIGNGIEFVNLENNENQLDLIDGVKTA